MDIIAAMFAFVTFMVCAFIWLLPIVFILASDKTTGREKVAWILAVVFVSWFAWIFYWLLAPIKERDPYYY